MLSDEVKQDIIIKTIKLIWEESREEKLKLFRHALVNACLQVDANQDSVNIYFRFLAELELSHITLLSWLHGAENSLKDITSYPELYEKFMKSGHGKSLGLLSEDEFKLLCDELQQKNLIEISEEVGNFNTVKRTTTVVIDNEQTTELPNLRTTDVGKRFIKFIIDPSAGFADQVGE